MKSNGEQFALRRFDELKGVAGRFCRTEFIHEAGSQQQSRQTCENAQIAQQLLKKINVNIELDPMLVPQMRGNEVSGNYLLSSSGAAIDFDDPIDSFGQLFITNGGRWYQRHSLTELDKLFAQQKFMADPEARQKVVWEMDSMAMNDAAYLILIWSNTYHVRWNFVKGWTHTPNIRSTNARMDYVWLDFPELPHAR